MSESRDGTQGSDAQAPAFPHRGEVAPAPVRSGWGVRLAPAGGLVLGLLLGALAWLGALTLWRLLG